MNDPARSINHAAAAGHDAFSHLELRQQDAVAVPYLTFAFRAIKRLTLTAPAGRVRRQG